MQKDIKRALQIMKPELKILRISYFWIFLFYTLYTILFIFGIDAQKNRFAGLDIFFVMLFIFGPLWFRPKELQIQKPNGDVWASPLTIMNLQLPIKRNIIVLKSIIFYFLGSFPFQLYMFVILYSFSPEIRTELDLISYLSFAIIWLSFGIYFGFSSLPIEVGYKMKSSVLNTILSLLLLGAIVVIIIVFPFYFTYGIVEWTIIFAIKWPIISAVISIFAAIIGYYYWKNKMLKLIKQADFQ
ncbi:hypothetical protein [Ornithinibacillus scapharcae]|uniref:hypothetical protein n=1 Tax=Ornithinibacillus scapharcae TaxID=1147159 RepID=UPI000225B3AF|nr:hypothetical protein [Ornithinibacillus scapharcae]